MDTPPCLIPFMDFPTLVPNRHNKRLLSVFVWHGMKKDIWQWCQECHSCQASKLHRHTRAPLQERTLPTTRFQSIHIDLVGPLPVSQNNRYLLTITDRFTRWPEAIPLPDSQAATCTMALLQHWIARFSVPEDITSDRGLQFYFISVGRISEAVWHQSSSNYFLSSTSKRDGGATSPSA